MKQFLQKIGRALGLLSKAADNVGQAIGEFEHDDPKKPQPGMPPRPIDTPDPFGGA